MILSRHDDEHQITVFTCGVSADASGHGAVPTHYAVLAALASFAAFQAHGSNVSSSWFFVRPETTRSSASVNHASGLTPFNFADTINVATIAQCRPPRSERGS
jgi:hypothetical protein